MIQTFQCEHKATFGTLSLRFCDHEPAPVGVTYVFWRADIETGGVLEGCIALSLIRFCASPVCLFAGRGWIVCNGIQKAVTD